MTGTFIHGTRSRKDEKSPDSAYVMLWALLVLAVFALLPCSFLAMERMKLESLEKQSSFFYRELEENNSRILSQWKANETD